MAAGRIRIIVDSLEALEAVLMDLVTMGLVDPESIRRRKGRGSQWIAYGRLMPEFS